MILFSKKPRLSKELTVFIIFSTSLFDIISIIVQCQYFSNEKSAKKSSVLLQIHELLIILYWLMKYLQKALQRFATCLSVSNILRGKLGDLSARVAVSSFSIPSKSDDSFIPVSFLMLILIY